MLDVSNLLCEYLNHFIKGANNSEVSSAISTGFACLVGALKFPFMMLQWISFSLGS